MLIPPPTSHPTLTASPCPISKVKAFGKPTWCGLVKAVDSINRALAQMIARDHPGVPGNHIYNLYLCCIEDHMLLIVLIVYNLFRLVFRCAFATVHTKLQWKGLCSIYHNFVFFVAKTTCTVYVVRVVIH